MIPSEYGSSAPAAAKSSRNRHETTRRPPANSSARSSARASSFSFANCTVPYTSRNVTPHVTDLQEPILAGKLCVAGQEHHGFLAELAQRERRAEHRPERVAVRVLVCGDEEAVVVADRVRDGLKVSPAHRQMRRARVRR